MADEPEIIATPVATLSIEEMQALDEGHPNPVDPALMEAAGAQHDPPAETAEDLMRDTVDAMQTRPERCDCPALDGPHVHLAGGPERIEAD